MGKIRGPNNIIIDMGEMLKLLSHQGNTDQNYTEAGYGAGTHLSFST